MSLEERDKIEAEVLKSKEMDIQKIIANCDDLKLKFQNEIDKLPKQEEVDELKQKLENSNSQLDKQRSEYEAQCTS